MVLFHIDAKPFTARAAGRCLRRTVDVQNEVERRFGAADLGCYANRPKTGTSSSPSVHRDGRAFDAGFAHDGSDASRDRAFRWLTDNAAALGVQQVLMYRRKLSNGKYTGGKMWELPTGPSDTRPRFRSFSKSGHWLHVELHPSVADLPLGSVAPSPLPPPTIPPSERRVMVNANLPVLIRGSKGMSVRKAQAIMAACFAQRITIDGDFGSQTTTAVLNVQRFFSLKDDDRGTIGIQTWFVLLNLPT